MDNWDRAAHIIASDMGEIMMRMAFDIVLNSANLDSAEYLEIVNLRKLTVKEMLSPELDERPQRLVILVLQFAIGEVMESMSSRLFT